MPVPTARRRTTPGTALAFLLPLTLALGGCGLLPMTVSHYRFDPAPVQDGYDCLADGTTPPGSAPTKGSVPEGFEPAEAVLCSMDLGGLSPTSGPVRQKIREDYLSGDLSALLAALAVPSDRSSTGACTADGQILPNLWLVNASGKAIHVQWPLDRCSKAKPGTLAALAALAVRETRFLDVPAPPTGSQPQTTAP